MIYDKKQITKAVYELYKSKMDKLGRSDLYVTNEEKALSRWWCYGRSTRTFRLSTEGRNAFFIAEIEGYPFKYYPTEYMKTGSQFLELNRKIQCPYFYRDIRNPKNDPDDNVIIYDESVACMIKLYGGLEEYVKRKTSTE